MEWDKEKLPIKYFYGKSIEYIENSVKTTYDSGRVAVHKKNTHIKRKISLSYHANRQRLLDFQKWYQDNGGDGSTFTIQGLDIDNKGDNSIVTYYFDKAPRYEGADEVIEIGLDLVEE